MANPSLFMKAKNLIAKHYGGNVGKMLIHTGVISWILSSAAQVAAIAMNDKIPKEQKLFLIPQECADAAVNIASFYIITQSFKTIGSQLVQTGKWLPSSVRKFLKNTNFTKIGKIGTDIAKDAKLPAQELKDLEKFQAGMDFVVTTTGSILSCNIVTPIIRNKIAARRQKRDLAKMNNQTEEDISNINTVKPTSSYLPKPSMVDFQARGRSVYSNSAALKI